MKTSLELVHKEIRTKISLDANRIGKRNISIQISSMWIPDDSVWGRVKFGISAGLHNQMASLILSNEMYKTLMNEKAS